ncbi:MAG: 4'-phosphopantetheinyl transferase superfamily protein [Thermomonas sp.]
MPDTPAAVHAHCRVRLARLDAVTVTGHDWLGDDEATRLAAMTSPDRRRSFLAGHWLARELAADWLQVESRRITLQRHDDGRPLLLLDGRACALSLSISHSGDWLAVALANVPVGVDVELPRRQRDLDALARFAFSPEEAQRLQDLPEVERSTAFHLLWALKEARGKRSGEGILPARSRQVTAIPSSADAAEAISWQLGEGALVLAVDAGTVVSVETSETPGLPQFWRYSQASGASSASTGDAHSIA